MGPNISQTRRAFELNRIQWPGDIQRNACGLEFPTVSLIIECGVIVNY